MNYIKDASKTELLREAILATADENGIVTTQGVFQAARNPNSILHGEFEWNGDKAVETLGLQRAAELIRTVRIKVVVDSRKIIAPFYVSNPSDSKTGEYLPIASIKSNDVMKHGVLLAEMSRIEGAIKRASAIAGVLDIEGEFESMMQSVHAIRQHINGCEGVAA